MRKSTVKHRLRSNVVSCRKFRLPYHLTLYHKYERKVKTYGKTDAECEADDGKWRYHDCAGQDDHGELYPEIDCGYDLASGESDEVGGVGMTPLCGTIICGISVIAILLAMFGESIADLFR